MFVNAVMLVSLTWRDFLKSVTSYILDGKCLSVCQIKCD